MQNQKEIEKQNKMDLKESERIKKLDFKERKEINKGKIFKSELYKYKYRVGNRVKTNKGYEGVIKEIHRVCPESCDWIEIQTIPVTEESIRRPWYTISRVIDVCIFGVNIEGSICVAESNIVV